jgi:hypothetical protein
MFGKLDLFTGTTSSYYREAKEKEREEKKLGENIGLQH